MATLSLRSPRSYGADLDLPLNSVALDNDEMEYVDGGGTISLTISSNSLIISLLSAVGGSLTYAKAVAILTGAELTIASSVELGTAGLGTLYVGAFLLAFDAIIPTIASAAVTYGVNRLKGLKFQHGWPLPDLNISI